jgi:DNA-binding beta-propeller fold protein YncE
LLVEQFRDAGSFLFFPQWCLVYFVAQRHASQVLGPSRFNRQNSNLHLEYGYGKVCLWMRPMEQLDRRPRRIALSPPALLFGLACLIMVAAPSGARPQAGGLTSLAQSGVNSLNWNPFQVATLHWATIRGTSFPNLQSPRAMAFDGSSMWITNGDNLYKVRPSDGKTLATFTVLTAGDSYAIAFDGANLWIPDAFNSSISEVRARDGKILKSFSVGHFSDPTAVAFDGVNIWVPNGLELEKIRASDGAILAHYPFGDNLDGSNALAFDGSNIWALNEDSSLQSVLTKMRASDGTVLGNFPLGSTTTSWQIAFDGNAVWVANSVNNTVTQVRASDGLILGIFAVGQKPFGVVFDGANIWVSNSLDNTVTKLRVSDGSVLGTFATDDFPLGMGFDGSNVWVANNESNTISKF